MLLRVPILTIFSQCVSPIRVVVLYTDFSFTHNIVHPRRKRLHAPTGCAPHMGTQGPDTDSIQLGSPRPFVGDHGDYCVSCTATVWALLSHPWSQYHLCGSDGFLNLGSLSPATQVHLGPGPSQRASQGSTTAPGGTSGLVRGALAARLCTGTQSSGDGLEPHQVFRLGELHSRGRGRSPSSSRHLNSTRTQSHLIRSAFNHADLEL